MKQSGNRKVNGILGTMDRNLVLGVHEQSNVAISVERLTHCHSVDANRQAIKQGWQPFMLEMANLW